MGEIFNGMKSIIDDAWSKADAKYAKRIDAMDGESHDNFVRYCKQPRYSRSEYESDENYLRLGRRGAWLAKVGTKTGAVIYATAAGGSELVNQFRDNWKKMFDGKSGSGPNDKNKSDPNKPNPFKQARSGPSRPFPTLSQIVGDPNPFVAQSADSRYKAVCEGASRVAKEVEAAFPVPAEMQKLIDKETRVGRLTEEEERRFSELLMPDENSEKAGVRKYDPDEIINLFDDEPENNAQPFTRDAFGSADHVGSDDFWKHVGAESDKLEKPVKSDDYFNGP